LGFSEGLASSALIDMRFALTVYAPSKLEPRKSKLDAPSPNAFALKGMICVFSADNSSPNLPSRFPRSLRRVSGRKSYITDAQWIQTLHNYGLLESSFRPQEELVAMRTLLRHRSQLLKHRAPHIQHMQKALLQMNIQLKTPCLRLNACGIFIDF
jgi:hypothetical protein